MVTDDYIPWSIHEILSLDLCVSLRKKYYTEFHREKIPLKHKQIFAGFIVIITRFIRSFRLRRFRLSLH
jgi:hypothetical protein